MSPTLLAPAPTADQAQAEFDARRAASVKRLAAIAEFARARVEAQTILMRAAKIEGLPDLLRTQALAAAGIAGHRLHRVHGEATADDACALIDDLKALWSTVDPLVAAIGDEAAANFHGIDGALFSGQLRGALEGNATSAIECAGNIDEGDAPSIDPDEQHRAHSGRV